MTSRPRVLLRADASKDIGSGHVVRTLALAAAVRELGGGATLLAAELAAPLAAEARRMGVAVERVVAAPGSDEDALRTVQAAEALGAHWVVLDGYHFDVHYQEHLRGRVPTMCLDDEATRQFCCDLVVNPNPAAGAGWYEGRAPGARLLLGTRYALLRPEFAARSRPRAARAAPPHVVVATGGSDPRDLASIALEAMRSPAFADLRRTIVVGPLNSRIGALKIAAAASDVDLAVAPRDLADLFASADIAVSAGGSTLLELLCLGIPTAAVIVVGNQTPMVGALRAAGAVVDLGPIEELAPARLTAALAALRTDAPLRAALSQRGRELVDGLGAERVAAELDRASAS